MESKKLLTLASALCLLASYSFASPEPKIKELSRAAYEVIYDEEKVGKSERFVSQDENKRWIVESSDLLFESFFFSDTKVLGLLIETYSTDMVLQGAHYLSLYNEYLLSSSLKAHGEAAFIQTLMVYELSEERMEQTIAKWPSYQDETALTGDLSASLQTFLHGLQVEESYSTTIDRSKFDYTVAGVSDMLPGLLESNSTIQLRVFDPEAEEQVYLSVRAEVDKAASKQGILQVKLSFSEDQESVYRYKTDKPSPVLARVLGEEDGESLELNLLQ